MGRSGLCWKRLSLHTYKPQHITRKFGQHGQICLTELRKFSSSKINLSLEYSSWESEWNNLNHPVKQNEISKGKKGIGQRHILVQSKQLLLWKLSRVTHHTWRHRYVRQKNITLNPNGTWCLLSLHVTYAQNEYQQGEGPWTCFANNYNNLKQHAGAEIISKAPASLSGTICKFSSHQRHRRETLRGPSFPLSQGHSLRCRYTVVLQFFFPVYSTACFALQ